MAKFETSPAKIKSTNVCISAFLCVVSSSIIVA